MARRYRLYPNAVWCDVHGTHHEPDTNPYDMCDEHGEIDECGPDNWRPLYIPAEADEEF